MNPAPLWIAGLGLLLLTIGGILFNRNRRAERLIAIFSSLLGVLALLIAALMQVKPILLEAVLPNKIRIFMGGISVALLFITIETVRRNHLKERYALLWIGTGFALFGVALYPDVIGGLRLITGMEYTSAIMVVVFTFLTLIAFHVSLTLSRNEDDRRKLSQSIALLRQRVEELEKKNNS